MWSYKCQQIKLNCKKTCHFFQGSFRWKKIQLESKLIYCLLQSVFRTGEDEVHVAAGCSYPEMEPHYHEAGALPGSYSGEQQRRRTKGEGVSVLFNFSVCHIIYTKVESIHPLKYKITALSSWSTNTDYQNAGNIKS